MHSLPRLSLMNVLPSLLTARRLNFTVSPYSSPYPTLIYSISFKRSSEYYTFKLIIPSVVLTMLSFITFFMSP